MTTRWFICTVCLLLVAGMLLGIFSSSQVAQAQTPLDQSFTFQAQLVRDGTPVSATCTFQFQLFDAPTGGTRIGSTLVISDVLVENGDFTVPLTFGADVFRGEHRYMEVAARCPGDTRFIALDRRMQLRPTPYALFAQTVDPAFTDARYLRLGGNAGLSPAESILGTTDNVSLTLVVSDTAALRLEASAAGVPNVILGSSQNGVTTGVQGAAIGGGGEHPPRNAGPNRVTDDFGVVSGGTGNRVGNNDLITTNASFATIGGGERNIASGNATTVGGGISNDATGSAATVGGGISNQATGNNSTVSGGNINVASGNRSTIGGGETNVASSNEATVSGGDSNTASGPASTISGGHSNVASGNRSTVGGGENNRALALLATIGGGGRFPFQSSGSEPGNQVFDDYGTIGGGGSNSAGSNNTTATDSSFATVGGGQNNNARRNHSTIAGGDNNVANEAHATVGGGRRNEAIGSASTIAGGSNNRATQGGATVGGGGGNQALASNATVSGGEFNRATGSAATVPGGTDNQANGNFSFAAGHSARANHQGSFVWADRGTSFSGEPLFSSNNDTFTVRARNGTTFFSNGAATTGVRLPAGGGAWNNLSDRNMKEHFAPVNPQDILARLVNLPITTWNYRSQDTTIRHIGPVAQDFAAAFAVGENDTTISTIDADGVALAAIQGLHSLVQEQDAQIAALQQANSDLQQQNAALEARLTALEQRLGGGTPSSD